MSEHTHKNENAPSPKGPSSSQENLTAPSTMQEPSLQMSRSDALRFTPGNLIFLQRTVGNRRTQQVIQLQRQQEVDPRLLRDQLTHMTTQSLMRIFIDSFASGDRTEALPNIPRAYTRSATRQLRQRAQELLRQRFENAYDNSASQWYEYHNFIHVELTRESPEQAAGRTELYQMLIDSRRGGPLPEPVPLTGEQLVHYFNSGIAELRQALRRVAQGEAYSRSLANRLGDTQRLSRYTDALAVFGQRIGDLMGGGEGRLVLEERMRDPRARAIRSDIAVAEAARAAWRGLQPQQRSALSLRRSDTMHQLNEEVLAQTRRAAARAGISIPSQHDRDLSQALSD